MAKGNGKTPALGNGQGKPQPAYFKSLTIENVKCFKGKHTIDLSDGNGKPAQWTVILGNNNTGKTTLLKCLAGLDAVEELVPSETSPDKLKKRNRLYGVGQVWPDENFESEQHFRIGGTITFQDAIGSITQKNGSIFYSFGDHRDPWDVEPKLGFKIVRGGYLLHFSLRIYSYGASRKMSTLALSESEEKNPHASLFDHENLPNMEDWLLNLFLAEKLGRPEARSILDLAKKVLASGLLPDVREVRLNSREKGTGFVNFAEFLTDFGWIRLRDLGYGYQTMIAWVLNLVKRMIERYPSSSNPLAEPAIVLVDEIDLHLHPDWQRKIIAHLTEHFPNTQFIATAHSPLVVQSAEEVNIVILKKEGESVHIEQPKIRSFRGWTVEEILTDLMDLAGQTMSQEYLDLMAQFNDALQDDNLKKAEVAYRGLDKILHPDSSGRTLLKLQMSSLSPAFAV
jgi:energy-coupling factor transporter ATP-binding protein EcfA2